MANARRVLRLVVQARDGTDEQKESAAGALRFCALDNPANRDAVRDAGGIGVLLGLARDGTDAQKEKAAGALCALGADPTNLQAMQEAEAEPPAKKAKKEVVAEKKADDEAEMHNVEGVQACYNHISVVTAQP